MNKKPSDIWYEVYDLGLREGIDKFNEKQKALYNYIDMFYSLEMGGLPSVLYNSSCDETKSNNIFICLQSIGLTDLADTFRYFENKFKHTNDGREETWEEFLNRSGIHEEIEMLDQKILSIVTEERALKWVEKNYDDLIFNLY